METTEPASIHAELLEGDDETEAGQVAPPVVAVVVAGEQPGPGLDETLAALAAQDYQSLSVLVLVDPAGPDLTPRIAAAHPRAFVRRRTNPQSSREPAAGESRRGFGAAANEVIAAVEGAPFLLFCHDVAPDPDAVHLMVEEAYRSNAGIVGPKLVDAKQPEVLLEVGMAVDHYGVPFSGIEPGEVDQEQHDGVRDVFFVSHSMMLVRADLFHELGGFDPEAFPASDDIDLCWRARLAGARVIVAPSARARRPRPKRVADERAETRARVRMLCKSYSALALVWVLPCALFLGVAEAIGLAFTRRPRRGAGLLAGFFGAFAHPGRLRQARAATQALRTVDDGDVRDLMIHGSARARLFVSHRMHAGERIIDVGARTRERVNEASQRMQRAPVVIGALLALVVLFGSRTLLFGRVPEVVGFRAWPGIGNSWATMTGAWRTTFMGAGVAASPVFGMMAAFQTLLVGHGGLARSLVVGGALPLGAWGAYRLVRTIAASPLAGVGAAVAYAANPVARNALWHGEIGPLVCYALAPFVFAALIRAASIEPERARDRDRDRRARLHAVLTVGLLVAVSASVWPPAFGLALLFAVAYFAAVPFTRESPFAVRALAVAGVATAVAALLCTPWVWSLIGADAPTLGLQPRVPLALGDVLQFHTGRAGAGIAPWGILAAAVVPLAIASGSRLTWAMRAWSLAVIAFVLAWLPGRLSPDAALPAPDGLLVGAALGLAVAAGIGVAAVFDDLRAWKFGWRQVIPIAAGAGLALAALGLIADTPSGRWGLGAGDWASTYSWMSVNPPPGGFRVLWLGDPTVLPADAKTHGDTGFALTRGGTGDARALWAAPEHSADRVLADAIAAAEAGRTARLGHLLAPAGVRYIAFVRKTAPGDAAAGAPNPQLEGALARQLDLELSRVDASGVVYQNDAWMPAHALVPAGTGTVRVADRDPMDAAMRSEPNGVQGVRASDGRTEPVGPGTLLWSEAADGGWHAQSGGHAAPRTDAFGWTNAFALDTHAPASVHYDGGALRSLLVVFEVVAWIAALAAWFVTRADARAGPLMSRRAAFVGVLAVVAAIAIIVGNATLSRPTAVAEPAGASVVLPGEASSGVWFCPGLPPTLDAGEQRVTLTNVGATPADIVVTVLPDRGEPIRRTMTVGASSVTNTRRGDLGPPGAVTVETFGGTIVVEQGVDGSAGIDLSPCATRSATRWEFAAGMTLRGVQQWLVIDDPFASDAKVDITLRTNAGIRRPERLQGFDIARRTRAVIPIHDFAVRNERVAVEVEARIGRVVAGQTLVFTADAGATGVATTVGAPQPSDHWMFSEGASVNGTTSIVAIVNAGDDDAQVSVQAVTANAQPIAPVMVTVGRDDVEWVQLGNCAANAPSCVPVPDGAAYGLDVRTDGGMPVVAQTLGRGTDQAAAPGATTAIGQTAGARRTAFASSRVDGEQETTLTLVNPFATQVDARVALVHGGSVARPDALQKIALPPGRRVTVTIVDENTRSAENNALVVEAGGPVVVERTMVGAGDVSRSPGVPLPDH